MLLFLDFIQLDSTRTQAFTTVIQYTHFLKKSTRPTLLSNQQLFLPNGDEVRNFFMPKNTICNERKKDCLVSKKMPEYFRNYWIKDILFVQILMHFICYSDEVYSYHVQFQIWTDNETILNSFFKFKEKMDLLSSVNIHVSTKRVTDLDAVKCHFEICTDR